MPNICRHLAHCVTITINVVALSAMAADKNFKRSAESATTQKPPPESVFKTCFGSNCLKDQYPVTSPKDDKSIASEIPNFVIDQTEDGFVDQVWIPLDSDANRWTGVYRDRRGNINFLQRKVDAQGRAMTLQDGGAASGGISGPDYEDFRSTDQSNIEALLKQYGFIQTRAGDTIEYRKFEKDTPTRLVILENGRIKQVYSTVRKSTFPSTKQLQVVDARKETLLLSNGLVEFRIGARNRGVLGGAKELKIDIAEVLAKAPKKIGSPTIGPSEREEAEAKNIRAITHHMDALKKDYWANPMALNWAEGSFLGLGDNEFTISELVRNADDSVDFLQTSHDEIAQFLATIHSTGQKVDWLTVNGTRYRVDLAGPSGHLASPFNPEIESGGRVLRFTNTATRDDLVVHGLFPHFIRDHHFYGSPRAMNSISPDRVFKVFPGLKESSVRIPDIGCAADFESMAKPK